MALIYSKNLCDAKNATNISSLKIMQIFFFQPQHSIGNCEKFLYLIFFFFEFEAICDFELKAVNVNKSIESV